MELRPHSGQRDADSPGRVSLFGFPLDADVSADDVVARLVEGGTLVSYLNPYAWRVARETPDFQDILRAMDLVVCDGIAVRAAAAHALGLGVDIISMDDSGIGPELLRRCVNSRARVCLVGGAPEVAILARQRIEERHPGVRIVGSFSGYGEALEDARRFVGAEHPEIVLVGLGMGLQERFLVGAAGEGWQGSGVCVGGYFDRIAHPELNYTDWSIKLNVRFLSDLKKRPIRYLRRYGVDYLPFARAYLAQVLTRPFRRNRSDA